ncbi:hypothetical protein H0H87_006109 [Tephrocybe sp. NHM501043]|nr:hypothetical protein H0H87_006109 [Tephrocybe sp. NHM501043]
MAGMKASRPSSRRKGKPEGHVKRPSNMYIRYCKDVRPTLGDDYKRLKTIGEKSRYIRDLWNSEDDEVKAKYAVLAEKEKAELLQKHPGYRYKPRPSKREEKGKSLKEGTAGDDERGRNTKITAKQAEGVPIESYEYYVEDAQDAPPITQLPYPITALLLDDGNISASNGSKPYSDMPTSDDDDGIDNQDWSVNQLPAGGLYLELESEDPISSPEVIEEVCLGAIPPPDMELSNLIFNSFHGGFDDIVLAAPFANDGIILDSSIPFSFEREWQSEMY